MKDLDIWIDDVCSERSTRCKCGKVMDNLKSKLAVYFESFLSGWDDRLGDCGEFILSQCANCKRKKWWVLYDFHWGTLRPEDYFDSKAEQAFWDHLLHIYANNTSVMFRPQVAIKNGDSYFFMDFVKKSYDNITAFEVDGKTHRESKEYDKKRTEFLLANGVNAVRRYSVRFNKFSGFYLERGQIFDKKYHQR